MKVVKFYAVAIAVALSLQGYAQSSVGNTFKMPAKITSADFIANHIVLKLKPEYRAYGNGSTITHPNATAIMQQIGADKVFRKFPYAKAPETTHDVYGRKYADLTLIYEVHYTGNVGLEAAINRFLKTGLFQYAEPHYIPKEGFTPNDPQSGTQYHLGKIKALQAWDVSQGDTNVVVGITDTGTDPTHPDLQPQVKKNLADPINGVDDDNDGYIDNFVGWDLGQNDNNPATPGGAGHGIHVTGLAAAATNNNTGVAGVGFKCKFLPIKIADGTGALTVAYEGITYAADHGCKVINCSWGSSFGGGAGQDVIEYATINKDALVVAAAGNDASEDLFYPASYNYVLNVASTNNIDRKSSFSNFGYNIDVCAPGDGVLSTWESGTYLSSSGTSMASPVTAGAAAVVRSQFPAYNALQTGEKLRVTADFIDNTSGNQFWANKLGTGRINLFRALTENASPSIVMTSNTMTDGNDNAFVIGDTVSIRGVYINYLAPTTNLTVTLSTTSVFVSVIQPTATLGAVATMGTANNNNEPFKLVVQPNCPLNQTVTLKFTYTDGAYTATQYLPIVFNVDYINIAINDVATTITSKGRIGYNNDGQANGLGFTYQGSETLMYEGGLMIGTSPSAVSDIVRGVTGGTSDVDFQSQQNVVRVVPAQTSEFDVFGIFNDNAGSPVQGLKIVHHAYAWTTQNDRKYVMVKYRIINTSGQALNDLYAGIFTDWDIMDYNQNRSGYDVSTRMGYSFSTENAGLYAAVKLLSPGVANVYDVDNVDGGNGGLNLIDGFDTNEKYTSLSTPREGAGLAGSGNDVIDVVSTGPFSIAPNDTAVVAFALIAGEDLDDLKASAAAAQIKYDNAPTAINELANKAYDVYTYPNPVSGQLFVSINAKNNSCIKLSLVDMTGRVVATQSTTQSAGKSLYTFDTTGLSAGMYMLSIDSTGGREVRKVIVK
ncbi:MAG: S8 family peptidase [Sphingobacteriales bacterium JAD_PAG50586_3]|nr:MAG: S8 family peptidase [Sphingobacteriales bacterium JAD_PAG50586_3]